MQTGDVAEVRNAQQETCIRTAASAGRCGIISELSTESHFAARCSRLEDGELFQPDFATQFQGVAAFNPGQVVGEDVTVLLLDRRQKARTADGCSAIREAKVRQASVNRSKGNAGKSQLAGDVLIEIQLEAMCVNAVITDAKFVDQRGRKNVGFTQRQAAIGVLFYSIEESAAIQRVVEGSGNFTGLIFIAETSKDVVLLADLVIDTDIKVVSALLTPRAGEEVVARDVGVGRGKERREARSQRINQTCREDIGRQPVSIDWKSTEAIRVQRMVGWNRRIEELGEPGIENLANESIVAIAVFCMRPVDWNTVLVDLWGELGSQQIAEISPDLRRRRNQAQMRNCLPHSQAFIITKEKGSILDDRTANRKTELVLPVGLLSEGLKGVGRVEFVIPQELPDAPMKSVGS